MQKYNAGLTASDTFEKLFKNAEYFLHKTKKKNADPEVSVYNIGVEIRKAATAACSFISN